MTHSKSILSYIAYGLLALILGCQCASASVNLNPKDHIAGFKSLQSATHYAQKDQHKGQHGIIIIQPKRLSKNVHKKTVFSIQYQSIKRQ